MANKLVIGSREISPAGQVPVKFEIRFDDSAIRPNMTYALQARITVDGELWFINDTHHRVDPLAGEGQTILVKRVVRESDGPLHDTDWNLTFIEGFGGLPERAATLTITPTSSVKQAATISIARRESKTRDGFCIYMVPKGWQPGWIARPGVSDSTIAAYWRFHFSRLKTSLARS